MTGGGRNALATLAASLLVLPTASAAERAVAVTFDDLPTVAAAANDVASMRRLTRQLLAAIAKHGIPAAAPCSKC